MSTAAAAPSDEPTLDSLREPEFKERLKGLRGVDNWRNALWIAAEYLYLAAVIGATLLFLLRREAWGLAWGWNIPVVLVSNFLVGVGQHRLAMLGHEASHRMLFRNRMLNETVSNWFLFFPMWGLTHHYRVQHLAHHQFTNDPERDPVVIEMTAGGAKFHYPMPLLQFWWECVAKLYLWVPGLLQYSLIRARYAVLGKCPEPYRLPQRPPLVLPLANFAYLIVLLAGLWLARSAGRGDLLVLIPSAMAILYLGASFLLPERIYSASKIKPEIPARWDNFSRMLYITLLFAVLVGIWHLTGIRVGLFYILLWLLPLGTSFAFLMILREEIQHANTGTEGFSHTRNFDGNIFVRWALFPYRMDLHLPHHLYPIVPHRHLAEFENLLRENKEYREDAVVVEGHLRHG